MAEKHTHEVLVHKANVPMMPNETINEYSRNLEVAGREAVKKSLGILNEPNCYSYMVEAFADSAVFFVETTTKNLLGGTKYNPRYYATTYKRDDKTGAFTFTAPVEVVRVTRFEAPKPPAKLPETTVIAASKSLSKQDAPERFGNDTSAWEPAKKSESIFKGLL